MKYRLSARARDGGWFACRLLLLTGLLGGLSATTVVSASAPATNPASAQTEREYMEFVADHHTAAIRMGEICLQKATNEKLRSMCQNIIQTQISERSDVLNWLRSWYGVNKQPEIRPNNRMMIRRLESLPAGDTFNIEISKMFIRHHMQIIQRSQEVMPRLSHSDLRNLAQNIIATQSKEIEDFRSILCNNYRICGYTPTDAEMQADMQVDPSPNRDRFITRLGQ